jgi:periplasmic divalent cation tolerance protein
MKLIAVITSVGTRREAARLAHALVERRLAACAHISEIDSVFAWKGAIQEAREFRVLFKTTRAQYRGVERAIRELHSYELPAIHTVSFDRVYPPYAAWVESNSRGD